MLEEGLKTVLTLSQDPWWAEQRYETSLRIMENQGRDRLRKHIISTIAYSGYNTIKALLAAMDEERTELQRLLKVRDELNAKCLPRRAERQRYERLLQQANAEKKKYNRYDLIRGQLRTDTDKNMTIMRNCMNSVLNGGNKEEAKEKFYASWAKVKEGIYIIRSFYAARQL